MAVMTQTAGRLAFVALVATVLVSSCARTATTAAPPAPAGTTAYVSLSDSGHRPAASVAAKAAAKAAAAKAAAAKVWVAPAPAPKPAPAPAPAPKPAPKPTPPGDQYLIGHLTNISCVMTGADTFTASFTLNRTGTSSVRLNNYKGWGGPYVNIITYNGVPWNVDQDISGSCK